MSFEKNDSKEIVQMEVVSGCKLGEYNHQPPMVFIRTRGGKVLQRKAGSSGGGWQDITPPDSMLEPKEQ